MEVCEGQCKKNLKRLIGISIDGDTDARRGHFSDISRYGAVTLWPVAKRLEKAALSKFNTSPVCENLSKFALSRSFFLRFGRWICQPRW